MKSKKPILPASVLALAVTASAIYLWHRPEAPPGEASPVALPSHPTSAAPPPSAAGPVLGQGRPARHVPDRELFGSAWGHSPRGEFTAFAQWTRTHLIKTQ